MDCGFHCMDLCSDLSRCFNSSDCASGSCLDQELVLDGSAEVRYAPHSDRNPGFVVATVGHCGGECGHQLAMWWLLLTPMLRRGLAAVCTPPSMPHSGDTQCLFVSTATGTMTNRMECFTACDSGCVHCALP